MLASLFDRASHFEIRRLFSWLNLGEAAGPHVCSPCERRFLPGKQFSGTGLENLRLNWSHLSHGGLHFLFLLEVLEIPRLDLSGAICLVETALLEPRHTLVCRAH